MYIPTCKTIGAGELRLFHVVVVGQFRLCTLLKLPTIIVGYCITSRSKRVATLPVNTVPVHGPYSRALNTRNVARYLCTRAVQHR